MTCFVWHTAKSWLPGGRNKSVTALLYLSCRLYGWLLVLYPSALRSRYGQEMTDVFEQQIWEAWQLDSFPGLARVWSCAAEELILVALPARLNPGLLPICAVSLLSTIAVFYLVLWGVTPPIHCVK
jgi:hypothetical protein